jgi:TolA-binding protein
LYKRTRRFGWSVALCAWSLPLALAAQATPARKYFDAFAEKRLVSVRLAEIRELREQLAEAETLAQAARYADAALLFSDITEHPRFAAYAESDEFSAAYYGLGSVLWKLGAVNSAQTSLRVVLARGQGDRYYLPAFRRYVDIALAERQLWAAMTERSAEKLPADAQSELQYLKARERLQAGDVVEAKAAFEQVGAQSRFYASAQFELGALAADTRAFSEAQGHFCKVTKVRDDSVQALLSDARYFTVRDLAQLGEGRVSHELHKGRHAFDHYFKVPSDSTQLPEALFEAAYARYEARDADSALDLLDQLQARFPRSPFSDEASLLRGYVALARCDFRAAEQHFAKFEARFAPVVQLLDRTLKNPSRREAMYEALLRARQGQNNAHYDASVVTILGLLGDDAEFRELHARVRQLDRQAASSSRLPDSFELLRARYLHGDKPLPAASEEDTEEAASLDELLQASEDTRQALFALNEQLDMLRAAGVPAADLAELERTLTDLAARQKRFRSAIAAAQRSEVSEVELPEAKDVPALLAHDAQHARSFERRASELRPKLVHAANERALTELRALHARLRGFLRRARIGHIDAAMGEKRRIERELESLAAGRFPPERRALTKTQAYLRDDEEYWPYEGEDWPDEFTQGDP